MKKVGSLLLAFVASTMVAAAPAAAMDLDLGGLNIKKSDSSSAKHALKDNNKKGEEFCSPLHYR